MAENSPFPKRSATRPFCPYSDFLLHDIGTGNGIVIAMEEHYGKHMYQTQWKNLSLETHRSSADRMRTAPL
jgi:hypothetical protein